MLLVFGEPRLDRCRVYAGSPVAGHEIDDEPEAVGHFSPERREMARLEHEHAIAGRQRVDQRRFPRAGTRCGIDHHRATRLENLFQAVEVIRVKVRRFPVVRCFSLADNGERLLQRFRWR